MRRSPDLRAERSLWRRGYRYLAGLDEVGRGSWAGPLVAAAVILPRQARALRRLEGVRDSKQLQPRQREILAQRVREVALAVGIGLVSPRLVDEWGVVEATRQAMRLALDNLDLAPDYLLIDALHLNGVALPQRGLVDGDARCLSIAAASVVAKVHRDRLMASLEPLYPGYGFAQHKGYGTRQHRLALQHLGPTELHRFSFKPLRVFRWLVRRDPPGHDCEARRRRLVSVVRSYLLTTNDR